MEGQRGLAIGRDPVEITAPGHPTPTGMNQLTLSALGHVFEEQPFPDASGGRDTGQDQTGANTGLGMVGKADDPGLGPLPVGELDQNMVVDLKRIGTAIHVLDGHVEEGGNTVLDLQIGTGQHGVGLSGLGIQDYFQGVIDVQHLAIAGADGVTGTLGIQYNRAGFLGGIEGLNLSQAVTRSPFLGTRMQGPVPECGLRGTGKGRLQQAVTRGGITVDLAKLRPDTQSPLPFAGDFHRRDRSIG